MRNYFMLVYYTLPSKDDIVFALSFKNSSII